MSKLSKLLLGLSFLSPICAGGAAIQLWEVNRNACADVLKERKLDDRIQPFIPWSSINKTVRLGAFFYTGLLQKPAFIKFDFESLQPHEHFYEVVSLSKVLSEKGVGPTFYGTTFANGAWACVYEFVEGSLFKMKYDWDSGPVPTRELASNAAINSVTLKDVNRAFDVLDSLMIQAHDAQFILTANGHAVLIDFGGYEKVDSVAMAKSINDKWRSAFVTTILNQL